MNVMLRRGIVLLAVCGLAVVGYAGYAVLSQRYWRSHWSDIAQGPVTIRLEPASIGAGQETTIVAEFRHSYDFGFPTANDAIRVLDGNGDDLFYRPSELQQASKQEGFTLSGTEDISCMLRLAPPTEPPLRRYTDRQRLRVLPKTTSGSYVLRVEPGAYCNGLPREPVELRLEVTE